MKDILVTASFGLCKDAIGNYFTQTIIDREDEGGDREDIFTPITVKEAKLLSKGLNLEISVFEYTISSYNSIVIETIANGLQVENKVNDRLKYTQAYLQSLEDKDTIAKEDVQEAWSQLQDSINRDF